MREEVICVFEGNMIVSEAIKRINKKSLKLISNYSKISGYKVNTQVYCFPIWKQGTSGI